MGRLFGALCKACGLTFEVADGDLHHAELVRCDECGKSVYVPRESRRRAEHLAKVMSRAHGEARRATSAAIADEQHRIRAWSDGWRAGLPFTAGVLRRARARLAARQADEAALARDEAAVLAAHPLPPCSPPCACGGTFVRGARIRCPACGSTNHARAPSVPDRLVD